MDRWQDARLPGTLVTPAIIVALLGGGAGWFVGRALAAVDTADVDPPTCVLVGVSLLAFAVIGVGVDEHGLRIVYGPWAWPATRVPLSRIRAAWAEDVAPLSVGGWAIASCPGAPGQTAQ